MAQAASSKLNFGKYTDDYNAGSDGDKMVFDPEVNDLSRSPEVLGI